MDEWTGTEPRSYVYKSVPLDPQLWRELAGAQHRRGLPSLAAAIRQAIAEWLSRPDAPDAHERRGQ